jgi:small-conductance mechanosensitive channel
MQNVRYVFYLPAKRIIGWTFIVCLILMCFAGGAGSADKVKAAGGKEKAAPPLPSLETLQPKSMDDINQLLSRLSDIQVRQILIQQLAKSLPSKKPEPSGSLNRLEAFSVLVQQRMTDLGGYSLQLFPHSAQVVQKLTDGEGPTALGEMGLGLIVIICLALLAEWFCWRFSAGMRKRFDTAPAMQGWMRFSSALLRILPNLLGIVIFTVMSALLYALLPVSQKWGWRPLFIAAMLLIVSIRLIILLSRLIFSPKAASLRLVTLSDTTAAQLQWFISLLLSVVAVINILGLLVQKLEIPTDGYIIITLMLSLPIIVLMMIFLWRYRTAVADYLRQTGLGASGEVSWFRNQFAAGWHILAMVYVALAFLLAVGRLVLFGPQRDAAFLISIMIVPFYLILDQVGKWLVRESLSTVQKTQVDENTKYFRVALGLVRLIIGFALALWLLDIWGIELTFISSMVNAVFSILLTLILAHMIWSQTNRYIERKLFVPALTEAQAEAQDEEYASIMLSRSHTLLPVMRKFLGVVLVVMVTLIVLSSLGINITPLMAGAGVVGLAIGFGSQRLVTDILSGIFYLIDDAFRVGEYIEAGGISGTVEGFTLRNMKLRSDKGALQLIPFSKLGTITNYNRGGMVIKFSLALPADTDIDKVRKIIKKVGQKIQENPEFGPDLIRPIKSMGVKSIIDSVMTFRVKFTAKAGKQFLIQREAFIRVREALAKEGIHFASRKVIVEFPPGYEKAKDVNPPGPGPSPEDVLRAGAAAAVTQMLDEEAQKKAALAKKKPS